MLREGPGVWVCRQLVAEILERGGSKWKSPLIASTFLDVEEGPEGRSLSRTVLIAGKI